METSKVNVNINGQTYAVQAGLNVLEACRSVGVEVPFFCYHPKLKVAGSCRMCLVKIGNPARDRATGKTILNEDGSPKIAWIPKPCIACGTNVSENMHVITNDDFVKSCRQSVLEFLLLNHPLDCPICDKAGECKLQEYAHTYGNGESRYVENKNVKPKKREFENKIIIDAERCIECSRCIRFCREFIGRSIFGFTKRGSKTEISVYDGADNSSNYLLNVVDGCPVGALTEKAFRFQMRTWFLKVTDSICAESSAGVNTRVWSREGKIYRITPRRNDAVNDMFMSDTGRYGFKDFEEGRLQHAELDSTPCQTPYAFERAAEIMKLGGVAIVASPRQTLEEQYVLSALANACNAPVYMAANLGEDDGKLVSADRTPNMRGAFITGLITSYPAADFTPLARDIESGGIKTILCFGEDILKRGVSAEQLKKVNLIYCGTLENTTSHEAKVAIPTRSEFEKDGLWINRQFRVQKFEKAIDASSHTVDDIALLVNLLGAMSGQRMETPTAHEVRKIIAAKIPALAGCLNIDAHGMPIDAPALDGVVFPEKPALHFEPLNAKTL